VSSCRRALGNVTPTADGYELTGTSRSLWIDLTGEGRYLQDEQRLAPEEAHRYISDAQYRDDYDAPNGRAVATLAALRTVLLRHAHFTCRHHGFHDLDEPRYQDVERALRYVKRTGTSADVQMRRRTDMRGLRTE
jgi:hypothetical protein